MMGDTRMVSTGGGGRGRTASHEKEEEEEKGVGGGVRFDLNLLDRKKKVVCHSFIYTVV